MTNKKLIKLLMGHCGMSRDAARLFHRAAVEDGTTTNRDVYRSVTFMLSIFKELHHWDREYTVVHAWKIPGDIMFRFKWND